ncbi:TPA: hemagglutinin repeat-containing protein, partial [Escherichia coli]
NGAGISVFAGVNAAKGSEKGNGTEWTETTTDSGKTVTINSGRDTVLNGAQVNGNRIIADVGHDLLISSQQDTSKYDSKQTSVAAGGSFTFGSMTGSGYIAASRDKMKSRFDSVAEQTGMFAGDGGFDITVGRHTQLDGAVIASTATPDKNHLDTGTLGFSDLHNEADYKVSHSGISLSGGGSFGDKFQGNMPGGMISAGGHSGHAEGTTQAAVAEGTITIRDRDNQKQNLANLSRDPAHANDSISPIFDKEKEQRRLQTVGLISDIGSQVADIARTQGELNALKAAQDKYGPVPADATEEQRQAYLAKLRDTPEYKKEQEKYGTGSEIQRGIQAATAALQGLAGDNLAGALAGASAPELANFIGHNAGINDNDAAKAIAHAILGGAVAAMQGNNVAAGAAGAATGELAARAIAGMLYPGVKQSDLSEEQKQTISTLATVSAGLAGGLTGNSTASAAVGAQSGKNAAENNSLSGWENLPKGLTDTGKAATSWVKYAQDHNLSPEQVQAGLTDIVRGDLPESADIIKAILENNPGSDTVMALLSAEDAKDYALALLTSIPAEKALSLVGKGLKVIDNKILISAAEKISTAKPGLQSAAPRDLNEQMFWKQVESNPSQGGKLPGMNNDPRFPISAGFQKMEATHYLPDGSSISVHYQYNVNTGKAYDMKIVTPQRNPLQPGPSLTDGGKK